MKIRYVPVFAAVLAGLVSTLAAQQPKAAPAAAGSTDPFLKGGETPPPATAPQPEPEQKTQLMPQGLVRLEYFSLPQNVARKVLRQFPQHAALYDWLGKELENAKSEVKLERLTLVKVRGGQRSKVEEINEYPFPTEFDPAQTAQSFGVGVPLTVTTNNSSTTVTPPANPDPAPPTPPTPPKPGAQGAPGDPGVAAPPAGTAPAVAPASQTSTPWPYVPASAHSFNYRNTGWTLEVELTFGEDGRTVDLNIAPEHIKLASMAPQTPNGEILQPTFEVHRLTNQILTQINQPTLAGTISPPVDTGAPGGNAEPRTWLLFLTVTRAR